jgi:hypothetical protein
MQTWKPVKVNEIILCLGYLCADGDVAVLNALKSTTLS